MSYSFKPNFAPSITEINLKAIDGFSELLLEKNSTQNLLVFLDAIFIKNEMNFQSKNLVIADRDRLLAELYIEYFGQKIASTITCKNCEQKFDLDFSLATILEHYKPSTNNIPTNGIFKTEDNFEFRLPTGEDELVVLGYSKAESEDILFERCCIKGELAKEKLQQYMEEIAPMLNIDLQASCPECNTQQTVKFDMQSFFIAKFLQEKPKLISEIHAIASTYHWPQQEILNIPRNLRRQFCNLINN